MDILNVPIIVAIISHLVAQLSKKFFTHIGVNHGMAGMMSYGGFPSGHSASMSGAIFYIGFQLGFDSLLFGISGIFYFISCVDILKERKVLVSLYEYYQNVLHQDPVGQLKEHSIVDIIGGAAIGLLVAVIANILVK